jgi:hypothetical protein
MTGLVPVIHAAPLQKPSEIGRSLTAWMPGTRPGMTAVVRYLSAYGGKPGHDADRESFPAGSAH